MKICSQAGLIPALLLTTCLAAGLMCCSLGAQTPEQTPGQQLQQQPGQQPEQRVDRQQILQEQRQLRQQQQQLRQQQEQLKQQQQQLRQQQQLLRQQQQHTGQNNFVPEENAWQQSAASSSGRAPTLFERLQEMPPERQEQFLQNNKRYQNMAPQQQAQIRQRLETWNNLTPGQRQELRARQQVFAQMTLEQQAYVRQTLLPHWQQLPPPRRQAILQRLHSLRDLSEQEREARLADPGFSAGLSPEDRRMLVELAHLHVGTAPGGP